METARAASLPAIRLLIVGWLPAPTSSLPRRHLLPQVRCGSLSGGSGLVPAFRRAGPRQRSAVARRPGCQRSKPANNPPDPLVVRGGFVRLHVHRARRLGVAGHVRKSGGLQALTRNDEACLLIEARVRSGRRPRTGPAPTPPIWRPYVEFSGPPESDLHLSPNPERDRRSAADDGDPRPVRGLGEAVHGQQPSQSAIS